MFISFLYTFVYPFFISLGGYELMAVSYNKETHVIIKQLSLTSPFHPKKKSYKKVTERR